METIFANLTFGVFLFWSGLVWFFAGYGSIQILSLLVSNWVICIFLQICPPHLRGEVWNSLKKGRAELLEIILG